MFSSIILIPFILIIAFAYLFIGILAEHVEKIEKDLEILKNKGVYNDESE